MKNRSSNKSLKPEDYEVPLDIDNLREESTRSNEGWGRGQARGLLPCWPLCMLLVGKGFGAFSFLD